MKGLAKPLSDSFGRINPDYTVVLLLHHRYHVALSISGDYMAGRHVFKTIFRNLNFRKKRSRNCCANLLQYR